jgi:hypothetical protein
LLGESTSLELVSAALITVVFFAVIVGTEAVGGTGFASISAEVFLRAVIMVAMVYVMYETFRNWSFSHKASQGFVTIGFALLFVGQLGFMLALTNLGPVAIFLGYEGRVMGLFVLNAVLMVGIKRNDLVGALRRLGLGAPARSRVGAPLLKQPS